MTLGKMHFAGGYIYLNKRSDGSVLFANGNDLNPACLNLGKAIC